MNLSQIYKEAQQEDQPFEILHNYRRQYFNKKRNLFYETRRKAKKQKLKQLEKILEIHKKNRKQLEYISNFMFLQPLQKNMASQIEESTMESLLIVPKLNKLKQLISENPAPVGLKKGIYVNAFAPFSYSQ